MIDCVEEMMKAARVEKMPVKGYPAFTVQKQLSIEKLLMDKIGYIRISHIQEKPSKILECYTYNIFGGCYELHSQNWTASTRYDALALLVKRAIELEELDRTEVKKILEDD